MSLIIAGCEDDDLPDDSGNKTIQTAPSIPITIQGNYKTSSKFSNLALSTSVSDSELSAIVTLFKTNSDAFNSLGKILTNSDTSTPVAWNTTTTYAISGNKISYNDGTKYGVFVNKWWSKGNPPSFTPNSSSPWKLTKRTDSSGTVLTNAAAVNTWDSTAVYTGGKFIKGSNNKCYEAKYWTKNKDPILVESVTYPWETPWKASNKCSDTGPAEYGDIEVNPIGGGKPPIETPPTGTIGDTNSDDGNGTPVVPPVIPTPDTDVTPVNPPTPIETSGSGDGLPTTGYAFLRKVTNANWNWLFPLRSGKYNTNGGTRNQSPFANSNGSTDVFTLANFKKAVLTYNAYAKKNGYKQFLNEGTLKQQAQEFTVFWAKSARETSGAWSTANSPWITTESLDGKSVKVWRGALYWVEEVGHSTNSSGISPYVAYVDAGSTYTPVNGRSYYGRGVIQLSWNYNYGAFSAWLWDNGLTLDGLISAKNTLLDRPDHVATNGHLSILSGIWFWMTPQGAKPSSHDVMFGEVFNVSKTTQDQGLPQRNDSSTVPTAAGDTTDQAVFAYRIGTVINIVNGGIECNKAAKWHGGPPQRVSYYNAFAKYFNSQINGLNITTISAIPDTGIWTTKITPSTNDILKSATCYNQKSYYGW